VNGQPIRVCELFAGIGGFRYGLEKASSRFQTVYANDIDPHASNIYRYHYQDQTHQETDIHHVNPQHIPDFDILTGGFPCQPFSVAGKRQGIRDPRGTLFYEILRITQTKLPRLLLLENVPGLLSIQQGRTFGQIIESLGELGYICEWKILNSRHFGVPQNRRRIFIIAYLASWCRSGGSVFPIRTPNAVRAKKVGKGQVSSTLTACYGTHQSVGGSTYVIEPVTPTITSNIGRITGTDPLVAQALQTDEFFCSGSSLNNSMPQSGRNIRRLTPIECERLQGFSDDWTRYGQTQQGKIVEISKTQRYKCCGNAVTTNVITALGHLILDFFDRRLLV